MEGQHGFSREKTAVQTLSFAPRRPTHRGRAHPSDVVTAEISARPGVRPRFPVVAFSPVGEFRRHHLHVDRSDPNVVKSSSSVILMRWSSMNEYLFVAS